MNAAERKARLMSYTPQMPAVEVSLLRPQVVELIERVEFTSDASDSAMLKAVFHLAAAMTRDTGQFNPSLHLQEAALASYAHNHLSQTPARSRASRLSALRRVRNGRVLVQANSRAQTPKPYTEVEWDMVMRAAETSVKWRDEALLLTSLARHAAMTSHEIAGADASWVVRERKQVCLRIPKSTGEFRRVPVFDEHADRVLAARKAKGFLLRPDYAKRSNAISSLKALVADERTDFGIFTVTRARNTRIFELMKVSTPWPVVTAFAGLSGGQTHFVGDMVQFLGEAPEAEMWACLASFEASKS